MKFQHSTKTSTDFRLVLTLRTGPKLAVLAKIDGTRSAIKQKPLNIQRVRQAILSHNILVNIFAKIQEKIPQNFGWKYF